MRAAAAKQTVRPFRVRLCVVTCPYEAFASSVTKPSFLVRGDSPTLAQYVSLVSFANEDWQSSLTMAVP